ncbi:hypothetical protein [Maridesulfovibrio frigidus]|uniref:hypothetical protein n=1 Tax=Maridesulfovibrio frigidus TaxID=340956 RepID=UPI00068BCCA9|nr:hypothetical protein [Maridesulfovibrio frigidus]
MGLDMNGVRFMLHAFNNGVDFTRSATIGRQNLALSPYIFKKSLEEFGYSSSDFATDHIFKSEDGFADSFFKSIGADSVESYDNSSYENATHIHDMNEPLPEHLKEKYSMVFDGGSLEHVFNFPVGIKNCMEMVEVGGYFLGSTPANNYLGHGFYQFSPELYYSIFTKENGFELESMIAYIPGQKAWFSVASPKSVQGRVYLDNSNPVYLMIKAKRISKKNIFETSPQQSDYAHIWDCAETGEDYAPVPSLKRKIITWLKMQIPQHWKPYIKRVIRPFNVLFDRRFFTPMNPTTSSPNATIQSNFDK